MPTAKDGKKVEHVLTVKTRGCRYYLEKAFKENLKGGEVYEISCSWFTGVKYTPSSLSPPKLENADQDNDDIKDTSGGYSSFIKKVLWQNAKGEGVLHEFSYNWLTGSRLTPVAYLPKINDGYIPYKPPSANEGFQRILAYVILENLRGGRVLHEYSCGRMTGAKLTPLILWQRPSTIPYDHILFYIEKYGMICQHFITGDSLFSWLDQKVLLQPYRIPPIGDDGHQHQTGPVFHHATKI